LFSGNITQGAMLRVWPAVGEGHIITVNAVHALSALVPHSITWVLCVFQRYDLKQSLPGIMNTKVY